MFGLKRSDGLRRVITIDRLWHPRNLSYRPVLQFPYRTASAAHSVTPTIGLSRVLMAVPMCSTRCWNIDWTIIG
ncbi:MAG TPA: hypothetical protein DDW52_11065 [Planctomycetaceae bacterium]|nr:hypothetical protein [Planctomycetaceae bacterium]